MSKLEIEVGDTVAARVGISKGARGVCIIDCFRGNGTYKISWDDYNASWVDFKDLTLIKKGKTMQFTKSDLIKLAQTETVFVRQRDGEFSIFINDTFSEMGQHMPLSSYADNLKHKRNPQYDIMAVCEATDRRNMSGYLQGEHLTPLWERTEQSEAQKEMEVLQAQAKALQEQITKLQSKL
jgi:hypothetical protein